MSRLSWAVLIVLIIIVIIIVPPRIRDNEAYLTGFWTGESSFLRQAGLEEMYLYISPPEAGHKYKRQGYLVMTDTDGGLVSNQSVEMSYDSRIRRWISSLTGYFGKKEKAYVIPRVHFAYNKREVMPTRMRLKMNATEGSLILADGKKIYAFLTRDNEASMSANTAYTEDI